MTEILARVEAQMDEWKRDLAMMTEVVRIGAEPGSAVSEGLTQLKRDYQGLRIMKVVSWQAPAPKLEAAVSRFEGLWADWVERATSLRREISG